MNKMKKIVSLLLVVAMVAFSLTACDRGGKSGSDDSKKIGFVTFGLGNDFFQGLADSYKEIFTENGWDADYADGEFNPESQIAAAENYITQQVDVLVIWAVDPGSVADVVAKAQDQGIKVIAFVMPVEGADATMVSDEAALADNCAKLAAKWIDETFADAADHSVPVAVFSCRLSDNGAVQADELLKIEEFSKKAKFVKEVECQDETAEEGQSQAESLYTTNPEIKVFLTPHDGLGSGINAFFTSAGSPVTDYSDMGIFDINASDATVDQILASVEGKSPLRGSVLTGGPYDTAMEIYDEVTGLLDGKYETGHLRQAKTLFVNGDTAAEYKDTKNVTSLTEADFQ